MIMENCGDYDNINDNVPVGDYETTIDPMTIAPLLYHLSLGMRTPWQVWNTRPQSPLWERCVVETCYFLCQ